MTLTAGTRLGPYEIISPLGAGGMGEVFRARDTKLDRDVAIKVLPESFAADADRVARFTREAKTLASLNHPNIAHIHGLEEADGVRALVMELVEGEDLSTVIDRGAIALSDALPIAKQIADALEAAHEQGIVHRDLKPQNIKVRADGTVKVLDFGLAKAMDPSGGASDAAMNSPTMTARATQMGMIIGTAAYMSPEQAKGRAIDKRADIWAFGVVLYEMLTGRRCFDGEDISTTLAAVLMRDPDFSALPKDTPPALDSLVRRCLERDPKARLRDIGEARLLLSNPQTMSASPVSMPAAQPARRGGRAAWIALAVVGILWIATLVPAVRYFQPRPEPARLQFDVTTPTGNGNQTSVLALSPDGRFLANLADLDYSGSNAIWVRALDGSPPRSLPKTVGATQLFWAPDSQRLGFFTPGKLQTVDVLSGATQDLCPIDVAPRGATWSAAGDIVYSRSIAPGALFRVRETGGTAVEILKPDPTRQEAALGFPQFLPDGRHFLYLSIGSDPARRAIYAGSLDGGPPMLIVAADSMPIYASGWLLYVRGSGLFAHAFDAGRLRLTGEPVQIADGVMGTANASGRFAFSASDTGLLAFRTGTVPGASSDLTWVSRDGKAGTTVGESRPYNQIRLSPDEKRVVFSQPDVRGLGQALLTIDLGSGVTSQFTVDVAAANDPVWAPDSETVAFEAAPKGTRQIYRQTIGSRTTSPIFESPEDPKWLDDWSPDGKFLLFHTPTPYGRLQSVPAAGGASTVVAESKGALDGAHFSPDSKWVVYQTNETGAYEVWVAAFPAFSQRRQVSARGGGQAFWRGDGRELFYLTADGKMMSLL